MLQTYGDRVLDLDGDAAQLWGRLRVPNPHNAIDKQIAAIALLHDLTVVTRNTADFTGCGVRLLNPFQAPCRPPDGFNGLMGVQPATVHPRQPVGIRAESPCGEPLALAASLHFMP